MIDEKKLVAKLKRKHVKIPDVDEDRDGFYHQTGFNCAITHCELLIKKQPKVGEWIPIGQYPTEPCLLCFENGEMLIGYYDEWEDSYICGGYVISLEPIAWMPLPQPYKGGVGR